MTAAEQIRAALDEARLAIYTANAELSKICESPKAFRMSIPVHPNDTDELIQRAFDKGRALLAAVRVLTECTEAAACTCHVFALGSSCPRCYTLAEAARLLGEERG